MPQLSRRTFIEIAGLAGAGLLGGCGGAGRMIPPDAFPVLVFSDLHFQPFLVPFPQNPMFSGTLAANITLLALLEVADTSEWPAIFEGSANGLNLPPSVAGTDANYALLALTLESIRGNLRLSPAVLYTGDFLGHNLDQLYLAYSVNKTAADAAAFVDKTLKFVLQQIRVAVGAVPVYFVLGNADSYGGFGPDGMFLARNAQQLFGLALNGEGNEQEVLSSLVAGGYYAAEPVGMDLMILGLNTTALSPGSTADATMIANQFAWFNGKLADARAKGKRVWLLMHVPPGADEDTTGQPTNDSGQIAIATMMWTSTSQATFMGILEKYPGVIAMSLAGHTHMDEFRLMSPGNPLAITAGISPCFGNNPAYKIFTLDSLSLAAADYSAVNCNLQASSAAFSAYYTFSEAYEMEGPLATSLEELFPALQGATPAQKHYRSVFHSGNNALTTANPITATNWPVYWCGIGFMNQQDFFTEVNAF